MRTIVRFICLLASASAALIAPAYAALTYELITGDSATNIADFPVDSNKCPIEGPVAAYVAGRITNTGGSTITGIQATISGLGAGFSLSGTQTATIEVGSLAAGDDKIVGWLISYPCTDGATINPTVTVTDDQGGSDTDNLTFVVREAQSANAGGNVLSTTLGAGAIVGQTITADVQYDFGNIGIGNEFILHPVGNSDFDAACLQLVGSEITASNITGITVGDENQLYFVSPIKQAGNGYTATVRFYFRYLCGGVTSTARPFAGQTSGGTNIKYTGNFDGAGALVFNFPTPTIPFTISKSATPSPLVLGSGPHTVTYTVTLTNPSAYDTVIDGFEDALPSGVSFGAIDGSSDVTAANSTATPTNGDTGTVSFSGLTGTSYALAGGSSISLIYTTTVQDVAGDYVNNASAIIGSETVGPASSTVTVAAPELTVAKTVDVYDPASSGLYMIPGEDVVYTFTVENTGVFATHPDSILLVDDMPAEIEFYNGDFDPANSGMGPFDFDPGASNLVCCSSGEVDYSQTSGPSPAYGYAPSLGYDGAVTYIRFAPTGVLQPGEQFTVSFRARIE